MIIYKKYVFTIQRLILYLTVIILLDNIAHILDIGNSYVQSDSYCMVIASLTKYLAWCMLLSVDCFLIEMIYRIKYFRETGAIEWLYIPAIFLTPLLVAWIPFLTGSYGKEDNVCTIVVFNTTTCQQENVGLALQLVLWWIPLYVTIIMAGFGYVYILWKLWKSKKRYTAVIELDRELMYQKTVDDVNYMKWYPLIYVLINIVPTISTIVYYSQPGNTHLFPLHLISTAIERLQGGFIAIVATLDPKTRKRMKWRHIKAAFIENVLCRDNIEEYPIMPSSYTDSLNLSEKEALRSTQRLYEDQ